MVLGGVGLNRRTPRQRLVSNSHGVLTMWDFCLFLLAHLPILGMGFGMGMCCCTSCQFFSDDFSSNDIANYTQVSGSPTISGGLLNMTNSTTILTGNTANPNSDSNTKITVTVNAATSGDTARIIL